NLAAPSQDEAIQVLAGIKGQYEKFHGVVFGEGAIEAAVYASGRFLAHRYLPERAVDLIDEAGARARMRRETEPGEVAEARKRLRHVLEEMDRAIQNHEFARARELEDDQSRERENLRLLREKYHLDNAPAATITPEDIEQLVAERAGVPVSAVRSAL